jgi:exopolysaccharide production protein ExoZ
LPLTISVGVKADFYGQNVEIREGGMLKTLQAGRAVACVAVAAYHLSMVMGQPRFGNVEVLREYTRHGCHGVEFFFVLSGFIIYYAHKRDIGDPAAWPDYLYRRWVRLFPIYWLYTLVFSILVLVAGGVYATTPTRPLDWLTSLSLVRFSAADTPIPAAWTLFYELAFYSLFSLLILSRRIGLCVFVFMLLLPLLVRPVVSSPPQTAITVYTSSMNWLFAAGVGACWLHDKKGNGTFLLLAALAVLAAAYNQAPFPETWSPVLRGIGFGLLVAGIAKLERGSHITVPAWMVLIGDASYSIYLLHANLETTLLKVAMGTHASHLIGSRATFFLVLIGSVALGCLAFHVVERPLLSLLRRPRRVAVLASLSSEKLA